MLEPQMLPTAKQVINKKNVKSKHYFSSSMKSKTSKFRTINFRYSPNWASVGVLSFHQTSAVPTSNLCFQHMPGVNCSKSLLPTHKFITNRQCTLTKCCPAINLNSYSICRDIKSYPNALHSPECLCQK